MSDVQDPVVEIVEDEQPEVVSPAEESAKQGARIAELEEQVKRVAAEFENFRRRQQDEQKRRLVLMKEDLFRSMLPIVDNLDRTLVAAKSASSLEALVKGVELVRRDFTKLCEENDIEPIQTAGAEFDPNFHEAMMTEERDDVPDQSILMELQKGYKMGDRVLRPSFVKVSTKPEVAAKGE